MDMYMAALHLLWNLQYIISMLTNISRIQYLNVYFLFVFLVSRFRNQTVTRLCYCCGFRYGMEDESQLFPK